MYVLKLGEATKPLFLALGNCGWLLEIGMRVLVDHEMRFLRTFEIRIHSETRKVGGVLV